jgi:hypothetical protein
VHIREKWIGYPAKRQFESRQFSKSQKAISEGKNRIDWNDYSVYFVIGGSVLLLFILLLVLLVMRRGSEKADK